MKSIFTAAFVTLAMTTIACSGAVESTEPGSPAAAELRTQKSAEVSALPTASHRAPEAVAIAIPTATKHRPRKTTDQASCTNTYNGCIGQSSQVIELLDNNCTDQARKCTGTSDQCAAANVACTNDAQSTYDGVVRDCSNEYTSCLQQNSGGSGAGCSSACPNGCSDDGSCKDDEEEEAYAD